MRFVVVTGMSGGGKRTALKLLEDAGFYCVDNLPVSLVEKFVELIAMPGSEISKVALGRPGRPEFHGCDPDFGAIKGKRLQIRDFVYGLRRCCSDKTV